MRESVTVITGVTVMESAVCFTEVHRIQTL